MMLFNASVTQLLYSPEPVTWGLDKREFLKEEEWLQRIANTAGDNAPEWKHDENTLAWLDGRTGETVLNAYLVVQDRQFDPNKDYDRNIYVHRVKAYRDYGQNTLAFLVPSDFRPDSYMLIGINLLMQTLVRDSDQFPDPSEVHTLEWNHYFERDRLGYMMDDAFNIPRRASYDAPVVLAKIPGIDGAVDT